MDYEDSEKHQRRALAERDPLPPDDWAEYGSTARAQAIYTAERPYITAIIRQSVPPQDVPDLVQETFRSLFTAKGTGPGLLTASRAYVAAAARSVLKQRHRSGTRRRQSDHHMFDDQEIAGPDPHVVLEQRDVLRRAEEAIARLRPATRDVFLMHRFDDLSYPEIARIKGMSVKRVEKHIAKALFAIRKARDTQS
ncbi:RNA polymerase sigma factor [Sphingopyxis terrae subsp. ummariensis]